MLSASRNGGILLVVWIVGCIMHPANAQTQATGGGVEFQASLINGRISLGEPLILSYTVNNPTNMTVQIDWLNEDITWSNHQRWVLPPWLAVRMQTFNGKEIECVPDLRAKYSGDSVRAFPSPSLAPGKMRNGQVVLSIWFMPPRPGRYIITVHPKLSYTAADGTSGLINSEVALPIIVDMANPAKLKQTAKQLYAQVVDKTRTMDQTRVAIDALFSVPEQVASPFWRSLLVDNPVHESSWVRCHLGRIGTESALALSRESIAAEARREAAKFTSP